MHAALQSSMATQATRINPQRQISSLGQCSLLIKLNNHPQMLGRLQSMRRPRHWSASEMAGRILIKQHVINLHRIRIAQMLLGFTNRSL